MTVLYASGSLLIQNYVIAQIQIPTDFRDKQKNCIFKVACKDGSSKFFNYIDNLKSIFNNLS